MKFELMDGNIASMTVFAKDEHAAWRKIKKAGIRKQSNLFQLVRA